MDYRKEAGVEDEYLSIEYIPKTGKNRGIVYEQFYKGDSFFIKEVPLPTENLVDASEEKISRMISDGKKPFRQYAGICASGQSVKTTLIRLYSIILQTALDIAKDPEYEDYIDPYYTLIGYFNSIRELGGAVRLLDDDIASRIRVVKNKYNSSEQRYLSFEGKKEITSRMV